MLFRSKKKEPEKKAVEITIPQSVDESLERKSEVIRAYLSKVLKEKSTISPIYDIEHGFDYGLSQELPGIGKVSTEDYIRELDQLAEERYVNVESRLLMLCPDCKAIPQPRLICPDHKKPIMKFRDVIEKDKKINRIFYCPEVVGQEEHKIDALYFQPLCFCPKCDKEISLIRDADARTVNSYSLIMDKKEDLEKFGDPLTNYLRNKSLKYKKPLEVRLVTGNYHTISSGFRLPNNQAIIPFYDESSLDQQLSHIVILFIPGTIASDENLRYIFYVQSKEKEEIIGRLEKLISAYSAGDRIKIATDTESLENELFNQSPN